MEKSKKDVLKDKPRDASESILTKDFIKDIGIQGLIIGIFTMVSYHIGLATGNNGIAMTMAFSTLCLARLFHGFNCRGKRSIFSLGVFSNKFSWMAFIAGVVLVNAVLLIPALQRLFEITPLSTNELLQVHLFAFIPTLIIQIFKVIRDAIEDKNEKSQEKNDDKERNKAA